MYIIIYLFQIDFICSQSIDDLKNAIEGMKQQVYNSSGDNIKAMEYFIHFMKYRINVMEKFIDNPITQEDWIHNAECKNIVKYFPNYNDNVQNYIILY